MRTKYYYFWLSVALVILVVVGGSLTLVYAQTSKSAFNLNSPASFPVDI